MLAQPSQLKFQAVSGTDGRYLILKTFIFFFWDKTFIFFKATCSAIFRNGKHDNTNRFYSYYNAIDNIKCKLWSKLVKRGINLCLIYLKFFLKVPKNERHLPPVAHLILAFLCGRRCPYPCASAKKIFIKTKQVLINALLNALKSLNLMPCLTIWLRFTSCQ